jgi:hypothetical protein
VCRLRREVLGRLLRNSITNTFVRDVYSKVQYSIPNFLTPRVFNVRATMKF